MSEVLQKNKYVQVGYMVYYPSIEPFFTAKREIADAWTSTRGYHKPCYVEGE